jgi:hypothetical protein
MVTKAYGGYMGYGRQIGIGYGDPICNGPSNPTMSDWIGGGAGWGLGFSGSGNFGKEGIRVGRAVGGVGYGTFYGEGKSMGGSWGFTW